MIVPPLVPVFRTPAQDLVVILSGFLHEPLKTDVAAHFVAVLVERQQSHQPRDAAVAVTEGMNAEEVEHQAGHGQHRRHTLLIECMAIGQAQFIDRRWCLGGRNRAEPDNRRRARPELHNLIVEPLPLAGIAAALLDYAVQPLEKVGRDGEIAGARVDQVEGPAIPEDLFLRAVAGPRVANDEGSEPRGILL